MLAQIATSLWKWLATGIANESNKMKSWQDMYEKTETVAIEEEELGGGLESWWEMSGLEEGIAYSLPLFCTVSYFVYIEF